MSGRRLTRSEYALQQVVVLLGELLSQLAEVRLTHTYQVVFRFVQIENIDFLVLRYLNIGLLPFEEFSKDQWYDAEI